MVPQEIIILILKGGIIIALEIPEIGNLIENLPEKTNGNPETRNECSLSKEIN